MPIRPLAIGEILDGAFRAIRSNPRTMIGVAAAVLAITSVITMVPQAVLQQLLGEGLADAQSSANPMAAMSASFSLSAASLPTFLLSSLATTVLNAMLVVAVSSAVLGQKIAPGQLWRRVRRRVPAAIGLSLLTGLLMTLAAVLLLVPGTALLFTDAIGPGVVLLLLGLVGAVVVMLSLSVRWSLAAPALLLEERGVVASMRRSWQLARGSFWRLLGIELLAYLVVGFGSSLIATPFAVIGLGIQAVTDNGTYAAFWPNLATAAVNGLSQTVSGAIFTPWLAAVIALLYIDLRMRREGLDLELLKAADTGSGS